MNPIVSTEDAPVRLQRYDHWPQLLHDFVMARADKPFVWGRNDCTLFVADAINAMTGVDIALDLRDQYSSLAGAVVVMTNITGRPGATVEDIAEHFAPGPEWKGVLFAQRGDVVLFNSANGPALGVVWLDGTSCVFVSQDGLNQIPLKICRRAWRVG